MQELSPLVKCKEKKGILKILDAISIKLLGKKLINIQWHKHYTDLLEKKNDYRFPMLNHIVGLWSKQIDQDINDLVFWAREKADEKDIENFFKKVTPSTL